MSQRLVVIFVSWPQSFAQYKRNASKNLGAGRTAGEPLEAGGAGTAAEKYKAMAAAGIHTVQSPADIGSTLAAAIKK